MPVINARQLVKMEADKGRRATLAALSEALTTKVEADRVAIEDFSIRDMFTEMVEIPTGQRLREMTQVRDDTELQEAITSSMFPQAMNTLIAARVITAYETFPKIGDELVTKEKGNRKLETIVGIDMPGTPDWTTVHDADVVREEEPYPEIGMSERYVTVEPKKRGFRVAMTVEDVLFDQTRTIMKKAASVGETLAERRERHIIWKVTDQGSDVFRPSGTATALYASTTTITTVPNSTLCTTNGLAANANIQTAWLKLKKRQRTNGDYVTCPPPLILLVPVDLKPIAYSIKNTPQVILSAEHTVSMFGAQGDPDGFYDIRQSIYMPDTTSWFLGNFARQFFLYEIKPLTVKALRSDQDEFERDIVAQSRADYFAEVYAEDFHSVVKSTA